MCITINNCYLITNQCEIIIKYLETSFVEDIRTQNQSPQRFCRLNQSNQLIPDEFVLQPSPLTLRKERPKLGIRRTLYRRDNKRKKLVGCHIHVYELDALQLAASKRGRQCRICMNDEESSRFIHPCQCKGFSKYVHEECLKMWIIQKDGIEKLLDREVICEVCKYKFQMKLQIEDTFIPSRFSEVPRHKKVCWIIEIFIILLLIAGATILGLQFGLENIAMDAVITLLCVVALVLIFYLIAGVVSNHTVEMIVKWHIHNFHSHSSDYQVGTVLNIPQEAPQERSNSQSYSPSPKPSPKARRKSIAPQFNGLQVIQFSQYPAQI